MRLFDIAKTTYNDYQLIDAENVYTSIFDAPLEDDLALEVGDGDNSLLVEYPEGLPKELSPPMIGAPNRKSLIVPLPRTLKYGMNGRDVYMLQRALSKAGLRKWGTFTPYFRDGTKKQVQAFQKRAGLTQDGVYGPGTHSKLARYYDAYGAYVMSQLAKQYAITPRDKIVAAATFGYNKRAYIHYTQSSLRMYGVKHHIKPPGIPYYEDCSSFATWTYYVAGLPDPNRLGYNGYGFTGTLATNRSRTYTPKPGDLAFYGYYPYSHVTIYIGNGRCISHGNEYGPMLLSVYYRPVARFISYL